MVLNNTGKSNQMLFLLWDFLHQSLPLLSFFMIKTAEEHWEMRSGWAHVTLELQNASKSLKSSICEARRSSGASVSGFLCLNQGFPEAGGEVSGLKATLSHTGTGTAGSVLGHVNTTTLHVQCWLHWRSFIISSISQANPRSDGAIYYHFIQVPSLIYRRDCGWENSNMKQGFFVSCF